MRNLSIYLMPLLALCTSCGSTGFRFLPSFRSEDGPELMSKSGEDGVRGNVSIITENLFPGFDKRSPYVYRDDVVFAIEGSGGSLDIRKMPLTGTSTVELVATGQNEQSPVVGKIGNKTKCVFIADASETQAVRAVDYPHPKGQSQQSLAEPPKHADWPDLADDGSGLLFSALGGDGQFDIHYKNFKTGELLIITDGQRARFNPVDSQQMVYTKQTASGVYNLFTIRINEPPSQITSFEEDTFDPVFSPDGQWIAYVCNRDGSSDIYVMRADGSELQKVVYHGAVDCEPSWTRDGNAIIFASDRNDKVFELYKVDLKEMIQESAASSETGEAESDRGKP